MAVEDEIGKEDGHVILLQVLEVMKGKVVFVFERVNDIKELCFRELGKEVSRGFGRLSHTITISINTYYVMILL